LSTQTNLDLPSGCAVNAALRPGFDTILTREALEFVVELARKFGPRVEDLLARRVERQKEIDAGKLPDYLPETRAIREREWHVTSIPADLQDRRVEITGPTDRKMIINALNSGAKVFMADCEDSMTPTWDNVVQGQINLRDAVSRRIDFTSADGKQYKLNPTIAALKVRPRGWHLYEKHVLVDGKQVPGAFVDFGLYVFHNHAELKRRGTGPYFYLPKTESHLEARLWAEVFRHTEARLGLAPQTIKATLLIEVILAAFEMDEILWELRDYIVGLNCGRWDYIFSFIKKFSRYPEFVLPDRSQVTMTTHFLRSYSKLLIKTTHRRGAFAMGGMAAQIPIKNDPAANDAAIAKVRADKEREAGDGHDGTWVAHPGLVPVAMEIFDRLMPTPNQLHRRLDDVEIKAADLLQIPEGTVTEAGLRNNVDVSIQYLARRQRLRADPQPDGGCGDRRDRARTGLAVDPPPEGRPRRRTQGHGRLVPADHPRGARAAALGARRGRVRRRQLRARGADHRGDHDRRGLRDLPDVARLPGHRLTEFAQTRNPK